METLKLSKSIKIDGVEKIEIEYDFDNLTGNSIEMAIKKVTARKHVITVQETDAILHAVIFAEAAGITYEDVSRFTAKDYMAAGLLVRNFFFIDLEDGLETTTSEESEQ